MSGVKQCPACAEEVKAEAKICRHCRYDFESGQAASTVVHPIPPKKRSIGKVIGIIVAVFIGLIVLGSLLGPTDETGPAAAEDGNQASAEPPTKVTARELFAAYDANEAAAQQKYGDRRLEVTGIVDSIDLDFADKPMVLLRTQNQFQSAQASLTEASQPKASSLSKGQQVVLNCSGVSEVIGTPMLADCEIQ